MHIVKKNTHTHTKQVTIIHIPGKSLKFGEIKELNLHPYTSSNRVRTCTQIAGMPKFLTLPGREEIKIEERARSMGLCTGTPTEPCRMPIGLDVPTQPLGMPNTRTC